MLKNKKMIAFIIGMAVFIGVAFAGSKEQNAQPGTPTGSDEIRIGVRTDIRRWAYYDKATELFSGAEVDYARELGKRMGYKKVNLIAVTPEILKTAIGEGDVDCLVSKCTIMDTSKEKYDFSPPYYEDLSSVMVEKSSRIKDFAGLRGMKIGVLRGTDAQNKLYKKMIAMGIISEADAGGTVFAEYNDYEAMSKALEAGDIDGFAADGCILRAWQDEEREILKDSYNAKKYGIAVLKDTALLDEVSRTVKDMEEEGVMDEIMKRRY